MNRLKMFYATVAGSLAIVSAVFPAYTGLGTTALVFAVLALGTGPGAGDRR